MIGKVIYARQAFRIGILAVAWCGLTLGACTRQDRDAAQRQANEAADQARRKANEVGEATRDVATAAGQRVREATATARDEAAEALLGLRVKGALLDRFGVDGGRVDVSVEGRRVRLGGTVSRRETAEGAESVASSVAGVDEVDSAVEVGGSAIGNAVGGQVDRAVSAAESRLADAVLETRVKARLIEEMGRSALRVEVEARDGAVALGGAVPDDLRRQLALQTAQRTAGVKSVRETLRVEG